MRIRLLIAALILLFTGQAWGATYYVNKAGSNTSPYDTPAKGATVIKTVMDVIAGLGDGGGHTIYIKSGTYNGANDYINLVDADQSNLSIIGDGPDTTILNTSTDTHIIYGDGTADGVSISGISVVASSAKNAIQLASGANNFTFSNMTLSSGASHTAGMVYFLGTTGLSMSGIKIIHNIPDATKAAIRLSGNTAGILSCVIIEYTGVPTQYGVWLDGSGTITIANSIIGGSYYAILRQSTGTLNTYNNIFFAPTGVSANYTITQTAGTVNLYNSMIEGPVNAPTHYLGGTIATDTDNLKGYNPRFKSYGKIGYVVPCVDDVARLSYAQALEPLLAARGYHGTYFVTEIGIDLAHKTALQTLVGNGTIEVACHSYSHSDLSVADGLKIWDTSGNITIDRAGNTITTAGGVLSGFLTMMLSEIKTALEASPHSLTITPVAAAYADSTAGAISHSALGEVLKNSGPGTTVTILVDPTAATGLYQAEMVIPKAFLAAQINSDGDITDPQTGSTYVANTMGNPYNTKSTASTSATKAAGFLSGRSYGYQTLGSYNLYTGLTISSTQVIGASVAATKANMYSILSNAAYYGQVVYILAHSDAEISTTDDNGWKAIFDAISEFGSDIQVKSAQEVANIVRNSPWTYTSATGISTRTFTSTSDYHLKSGSPAINAGVDVGLTTDYDGKPIAGKPDIGAYERRGKFF